MGRIRSIKPEFPQSESMGRIGREARLCFILLWTIVDDSGRARASSRMLASLLYPYDDDAPKRIEAWLSELEREGCIDRYTVDGNSYLQVRNWLIHQKIDRPSPSKIPAFDESSRALANPREPSSLDMDMDMDRKGPRKGGEAASKLASEVVLHESLPRDTWQEWLDWRRARRHPTDSTTLRKQLKLLAQFETATQIAIIETSINSGWQGLFAPKGQPGRPTSVPTTKPTMRGPDGKVTPEYEAWAKANAA